MALRFETIIDLPLGVMLISAAALPAKTVALPLP